MRFELTCCLVRAANGKENERETINKQPGSYSTNSAKMVDSQIQISHLNTKSTPPSTPTPRGISRPDIWSKGYMTNVQKEETPSTPTVAVPKAMSKKDEVTNTLKYVNATHDLLENGLFSGRDSNILIQVKAWLENQQKFLQLELAKAITAETTTDGK